jgi:hypothetical protein
LEEDIKLPIKETDKCEKKIRNVDNRINDQLSRELKEITESIKSTRIRRLPINRLGFYT